jgi:lipoate-protein ligase B
MRPIRWEFLGLCDYEGALAVQDAWWAARGAGGTDVCLALEHPPTVTLGRRATATDLAVPERELTARGVACIRTDRGGRVTYHGPGQIVVYPVVALRERGLGVRDFVCALERAMIETAAQVGVAARRDPSGHGVFAPGGKLGSVGIRVRRGVTTHGLALNVALDLAPFSWIVPCGVPGLPVTDLARASGRPLATADVLPVLVERLTRALDGAPADAPEACA